MTTVSPPQLCFRVCLIALPLLILGCANRDQNNLRMFIEQNQPFEVHWSRADRRPSESEEELIDSMTIDTGSKIVREKRGALVIRSTPLDDESISKLKRELLDSGFFELKLHPTLVMVDVGFTEISVSCNKVTFELRSYDRESTDPPELIQDKVDVFSRVTAAIRELSSAVSN
jgi:hypothetical protein